MPNLSKNAEIAQYFAHTYRAPENEKLAAPLTDLIEQMEDMADRDEYVAINLEQRLLEELKKFQQYSQDAGRDIQAGNTKSPNLKAASESMRRALKGFERMEQEYPNRYELYKNYFEPLRDESKVMTATQWIEQAKADYKKGLLSPQEAIRQIFAARQLANAERGCRKACRCRSRGGLRTHRSAERSFRQDQKLQVRFRERGTRGRVGQIQG